MTENSQLNYFMNNDKPRICSLYENRNVKNGKFNSVEWIGYTECGSPISILFSSNELSVYLGEKKSTIDNIILNGDEILYETDLEYNVDTVLLDDLLEFIEEYFYLDLNVCINRRHK